MSSTSITRYLCGQCGYLEEWITDQSSLQMLAASLAGWQAEPDESFRPGFDEVDFTKCPACGAEITQADTVCPSCGINFGLPKAI